MRPSIAAACFFLISLRAVNASELLWLSDIHFDPLADPALVDRLAAAAPEGWEAILRDGRPAFSGYTSDSNWALFKSALEASAKRTPDAAFTLVTGDLLAHHLRERFDGIASDHSDAAFRSFAVKAVAFIGLEMKRHGDGRPVLVALGNNDDTCGDYAIQPGGPFLQDTADIVSRLAGLTDSGSYISLGSYRAANPAAKHVRILVLNTIFFSSRYVDRCGHGAVDGAARELTWLESELDAAQRAHEKVWLVYHIPPGVDGFATARAKNPETVTMLWRDSAQASFLDLLNRYEGTVGPNFAGHLHVDDFRLFEARTKSSPFVTAAPAMSPITGQNPAFRVVTFDERGDLKDQATYYLKNLDEAAKGIGMADWGLEYDFDKEWKVKGLNAETLSIFAKREAASEDRSQRWMTLYSTSHVPATLTPEIFHGFVCASMNQTAVGYRGCVSAGRTAVPQ